MNINLLSNEQLAEKLENIYIAGQHFPRECTPFVAMAKFLRLCVQDSVPDVGWNKAIDAMKGMGCLPEGLTVEEIVKIINRHDDGDPLDDEKVDALATAIHGAIYGDTKPDEGKREGK